MSDDEERPITEAEYLAWVEWRAPQIAAEITEALADVLPEGMRFEWTDLP